MATEVTGVFILDMHASVLTIEAEASAIRNRSALNQVVLSIGIYREPAQTSAVTSVQFLLYMCCRSSVEN
jgi:hypothetical protein